MPNTATATAPGAGAAVGTHILVFPYPAQGHILPLLDLCHQLAQRGLTLTLVTTPRNLPLLSPLLSSHPPSTVRTLTLPFPPHPSLPLGVEHVGQIGNSAVVPIIVALSSLSNPIANWFASHPSPPVAIISDFFLGWTQSLADRLGVPRVAFFSSGPFFASVYDRLWRRHCSHSLPVYSFPDLPNEPSFPKDHLPTSFLRYKPSEPDWELVRSGMLANASSFGCVFNTFEGIEGAYLEVLRRDGYGQGRVYGVGPLSLMGGPPPVSKDRADSNKEIDSVTTWLDGCPDGSVLYVCFGSQKLLKTAQLEALALGLDRSQRRFVWVLKQPTPEQVADGYGSLPPGFEERVEGRGFVIKGWAPQVGILVHRAVGWFLSHCGWNSVLEAVAAGVVILGWPMEAEQFVNARLLVEDLGAAVQVWEGADAVPDPVELGNRIAGSMVDENGPQKVRARELREEALGAVGCGGSSIEDLDELVKDLVQLGKKRGQ